MYWSSTTSASYTFNAWFVNMYHGFVSLFDKGEGGFSYVWPVRGGQIDDDGDGLSNSLEQLLGTSPVSPDSDSDGIGDFDETNGGSPVDTDNDVVIDALDTDSDNDAIMDLSEGTGDFDADGVPNYRDADDDGDGSLTANDCAPYDPSIYPGATEGPYGNSTCSDTLDNDCDGLIDTSDTDCFPSDLIISTLTAPQKACAGAVISIKDTTKNQGTGTAGASQTCFYFSTNTTLDLSDTKLGCCSIPSLPPGGISTGTTSVTLPNVPTGKYYLIAMADDGKVVAESNSTSTGEKNNKKTKVIYIGPDLTVVSIVPSPLKPVAGQNVNITVTVKNIGCPATGPFRVDFYKNLPTAPALYQVGDFNCNISGLAAGASATCTDNVSYSPAGTYKMWAQVDTMQQVTEANETNNKKSRLITINP